MINWSRAGNKKFKLEGLCPLQIPHQEADGRGKEISTPSKWAECLFFTEDQRERVMRDLEGYEEGIHYKLKDNYIYIV